MTTSVLSDPLARYAARLHAAVGDGHHVASPLGAWLLLALCAPAASGADRDRLVQVLGLDVDRAAATAAALLGAPHPLVPTAAAVWHRAGTAPPPVRDWLAGLPAAVGTGDIPSADRLDAWARGHTLGMIERFPVPVRPGTLLLLATALATRVSWEQPFEAAPGSALGAASPWAGAVTEVLRTPAGHGHEQYVAATAGAGDVAVHCGRAADGLVVTSVIAAPEVPAAAVLDAAFDLAPAAATGGRPGRRSLFDLPLGEAALWTVTEEAVRTTAPGGLEEGCTAVLPAWSARGEHDLGRPELGFPAAAAALAALFGVALEYEARQSAVARYSRLGFEAAAVTAMAVTTGYLEPTPGRRRTAVLRFGHPYAVVAVATDERYDRAARSVVRGPWHGVPVFSAWVARPAEV